MSNLRISQLETLLARVQVRSREPRRAAAGFGVVADGTAADVAVADVVDVDLGAVAGSSPALSRSGKAEGEARVAAGEQAPESLDFEELDDLSDVEEVQGVDIDIDEPEPESGVDRVAASSMEQALASAIENPPVTPPPASTEQLTPAAPPIALGRPTIEQLGETVALDEGPNREFELDRPAAVASGGSTESASSSGHHLEEHLAPVGIVDHKNLTSPPEAREDLERMRLGELATLEAEVVQRPQISTNVVDFVGAHQSFMPETFVDLLDASLGL